MPDQPPLPLPPGVIEVQRSPAAREYIDLGEILRRLDAIEADNRELRATLDEIRLAPGG